MDKVLIKMVDGGLMNYSDDCWSCAGCPTCDYGSEYINEIDITLAQYKLHIKINQMYEYAISEGQMMRIFLSEYRTIQAMTEKEFIDWFKQRLCEITGDEFKENICGRHIEKFDVTKL